MTESTHPKVSVVIPTYNRADYLSDAIGSALKQTYRNIEIIVVDDGSTDETPSVAAGFGSTVKYIRAQHGGAARARNMAVRAATGDFIAFLDSDDVWLPEKLERQMELFSDRPELGMVYTAFHVVSEDLRHVRTEHVAEPFEALRNTLLMEPPIMSTVGAVVRRQALLAIGGIDERMRTSSDCDMACRLALNAEVAPLNEPLLLYRMHPGQLHGDPRSVAFAMNRLYDKLFGTGKLPPSLDRLERRARANLEVSLAGSFLERRQFGDFLRHAARALRLRPDRVVAGASRLLARPFRRRSSRLHLTAG